MSCVLYLLTIVTIIIIYRVAIIIVFVTIVTIIIIYHVAIIIVIDITIIIPSPPLPKTFLSSSPITCQSLAKRICKNAR